MSTLGVLVRKPKVAEPVVESCPVEGCGRPVIYARTGAGTLVAVDAEPHPDGRIRLFTVQAITRCRTVDDEEAARMQRDPLAVPLRTRHLDSCVRTNRYRELAS
jgi:hypothetical protein